MQAENCFLKWMVEETQKDFCNVKSRLQCVLLCAKKESFNCVQREEIAFQTIFPNEGFIVRIVVSAALHIALNGDD